MPKTSVRIIGSFFMMLVLIMTLSACAVKPEPEYAGSITEGILISMNENDYAQFSEHFDQTMKKALPEVNFIQLSADIKAKIGDYVPGSKEFWKIEEPGIYTVAYYKAKFTEEPAGVTVKVSFQEVEGEIYVSGLWFDSPRLRYQ